MQAVLGWGVLAGVMAVLWVVQWRRNDATLVDLGWAGGLGCLAIFYALTDEGDRERRGLVALLASIWAFRLTWHLLCDRMMGKPEDGRYQVLRRRWGSKAQPFFFVFFQAQAVLAVLFSAPMWVAMAGARELFSIWDAAGIAVWSVAIVGESIADRQLAHFRADPENRGLVCRVGLWRYSRHPNYFFEWLHWWTYPLLAVGHSLWWVTLFGPAAMAFFLFKVTGIPATEARALESRGEAYRRYQRDTSAFFPWFPREDVE